jgi:hypothetical protein
MYQHSILILLAGMLVQLPIGLLMLSAAIKDLLLLASPTSHELGPRLSTECTPTLNFPILPSLPDLGCTSLQAELIIISAVTKLRMDHSGILGFVANLLH